MTATYRAAARADIPAITNFQQAMAQETEDLQLDPDVVSKGVAAVCDDPARGRYYLAEQDGRSLGCLLITYEWSDWRNGQFWWIQSVYVHPQWRRRGVYRRLHEAVKHRAQSTPGVCGIRLYVEENNRLAQSVYGAMDLHRATYQIWEVDFVL